MSDFKKLTAYLLGLIVTDPQTIIISEELLDDQTVKINVTLPKEEMGKVIGKNGRVIQAIRTLLTTSATTLGARVFLNLSEPPTSST